MGKARKIENQETTTIETTTEVKEVTVDTPVSETEEPIEAPVKLKLDDIKGKSKEELYAMAEDLCHQYNDFYQGGNFNFSTVTGENMDLVINLYTNLVRKECFDALAEMENPMLAAVSQLHYETIKSKDEKVGEDKIPVRSIIKTERPIDLAKLHKHVKGGIGNDKNWIAILEKFNLLLTLRVCQEIGYSPKLVNDSYAMSDLAKQVELGATPTSNTAMLKTLTTCVQAMIGEEFKPTSHDVGYLNRIYSKKGRQALHVTCANHRYLRAYMAEICHAILEKKGYTPDFATVK